MDMPEELGRFVFTSNETPPRDEELVPVEAKNCSDLFPYVNLPVSTKVDEYLPFATCFEDTTPTIANISTYEKPYGVGVKL